jgi:hypothetical protein
LVSAAILWYWTGIHSMFSSEVWLVTTSVALRALTWTHFPYSVMSFTVEFGSALQCHRSANIYLYTIEQKNCSSLLSQIAVF